MANRDWVWNTSGLSPGYPPVHTACLAAGRYIGRVADQRHLAYFYVVLGRLVSPLDPQSGPLPEPWCHHHRELTPKNRKTPGSPQKRGRAGVEHPNLAHTSLRSTVGLYLITVASWEGGRDKNNNISTTTNDNHGEGFIFRHSYSSLLAPFFWYF